VARYIKDEKIEFK